MTSVSEAIGCLSSDRCVNRLKKIYAIIVYIKNIMTTKKTNQNWIRYEANTTYEITCTFEDEWQGLKSTQCENPLQRLIHFSKFIQCTYEKLLKHCKYELYTELSDPQVIDKFKIPRLHLHGKITLGDWEEVLMFKLNTLPNIGKYGRIQINKYRPEHWDKYITKDQNEYGKWLRKYESIDFKKERIRKKKNKKETIDFFKCV